MTNYPPKKRFPSKVELPGAWNWKEVLCLKSSHFLIIPYKTKLPNKVLFLEYVIPSRDLRTLVFHKGAGLLACNFNVNRRHHVLKFTTLLKCQLFKKLYLKWKYTVLQNKKKILQILSNIQVKLLWQQHVLRDLIFSLDFLSLHPSLGCWENFQVNVDEDLWNLRGWVLLIVKTGVKLPWFFLKYI